MDSTNNKMTSKTSQISLSCGKAVTNTNCPKMGSRRIFTPQFKLQVLESYRNDHDCKGNQRATARKYNIHRRQIQKWLQCEPSLRSSVANINQNAVKHQFHNVSVQQQQTKSATASQSVVNGLSYSSSQLQTTHLSLDSKKKSPTQNVIDVPSLSSSIRISSQDTRDILDVNFVGNVGITVGAKANSSSPSVSPLRPSVVMSVNKNNTSLPPPLIHHHHYGIPTFNSISSTSTVPRLVQHLNNSQQTYQFQNIPYTSQTLSHHQNEKEQSTYFTPLVLPTVASNNSYTGGSNERFHNLDLILMGSKTYPKILSDKGFLFNNNQFHTNNECSDTPKYVNSSNTFESFHINQYNVDLSFSTSFPFVPMDLSLRHNKDTKSEIVSNVTPSFQATETPIKKCVRDNTGDVVDLTYRKRRVSNTTYSSNNYTNEYPEKQQKISNSGALQNKLIMASTSNCNEDEDIEIEVGTEEKFAPTSKPVKLFKPYLLDECENNDANYFGSNKNEASEEKEKIVKDVDVLTRENTFPDAVNENINVCVESSNFFVESRSESPRNICSPTICISTMSPSIFQYSKGSPASSGYESSTSTYSDISSSSRNDTYTYGQTYSLNLQMQTIYNENINAKHPLKHLQRCSENDDSNSLETNPGIALYV